MNDHIKFELTGLDWFKGKNINKENHKMLVQLWLMVCLIGRKLRE